MSEFHQLNPPLSSALKTSRAPGKPRLSMASPQAGEEFGDVIDLSSSDEHTPRRKRSFQESLSEHSNNSSKSAPPSKRAKTISGSGLEPVDTPVSIEEGEVDQSQDSTAESNIHQQKAAGDDPAGPKDCLWPGCIDPAKNIKAVFDHGQADVFKQGSVDLRLPTFNQKREKGSWDERFEDWVAVFAAHNPAHSAGAETVLQAYYSMLTKTVDKKKHKKAKAAAKAALDSGSLKRMLEEGWGKMASDFQTSTDPAPPSQDTAAKQTISVASDDESEREYEPQFSKEPQQADDSRQTSHAKLAEKGDTAAADSRLDTTNGAPAVSDATDEATAQLQLKYFPSAADPRRMCLFCGGEGHVAAHCSNVACRFCTSHDHSAYSCPTRVRCKKCRQLGHDASSCTEKLALSKEEGLACCFCNATDHLEGECTAVWRSFVPDDQTISKVAVIVPSCSLCGTIAHYASDCAKHRGLKNPTWQLANRDRYVDNNTKVQCIEAEAAMNGKSKQSRGEELQIRGQAARRSHNVHFSESDDSETEFLGNRPVKKRGLGNIRMSSNIQMPPDLSNGRQRAAPGQPPLPPGPPPTGRGHALPPKPPPNRAPHPNSGGRDVSFDSGRGGRGGGGGRGGRGRGRGRGRGGRN